MVPGLFLRGCKFYVGETSGDASPYGEYLWVGGIEEVWGDAFLMIRFSVGEFTAGCGV
jgi:hypothetical protein